MGAVAATAAVVLLPVEAAAVAVGVTVAGIGVVVGVFSGNDGDERAEAAARAQAKSAEEARRTREAMEKALSALRPYKERDGLRLAILGALVGILHDADVLSDKSFADARSYCFGEFTAHDPQDITDRQVKIRENPPGLVQAAEQVSEFADAPWTEIREVMRALLDAATIGHNRFASVLAAWDLASRPYRPNQELMVGRT